MDRGAIILYGESFRYGNYTTRIKGGPESFEEQILCAKNQMNFVKYIQEKYSLQIDIYIQSYTTQYDTELDLVYETNLKHSIYHKNLLGRFKLTNLGKNEIKKSGIDYKFIMFMRIDIILKDKFFEVFNPNWEIMMFPFIGLYSFFEKRCKVCDMIIFIPKKYYYLINYIYPDHYLWTKLLNDNLATLEDFDVIIPTYHSSNTYEDINPFYYIVNRNVSLRRQISDDFKFNKYKTDFKKPPQKYY